MRRFGLVALVLLLMPAAVRAVEPAIVISEVGWAGSAASTADEWLELYNPSGGAVDLSGWRIEGAGTGGSALVLPDGSIVSASGTFLIANYKEDDAHSTLAAAPDWVTTATALSNSSLYLVLRDAASNTIDVAGAPDAPPFAGNSGDRKASMERVSPFGPGDQPQSWITSTASSGFDAEAAESGTPGFFAATAAPVADETVVDPEPAHAGPESSSSAVRIYELYPSPAAGESEWLELYNPSSVGEWLEGWTLTDGSEAATRLEGLLMPWSRLVVRSPKGSLNNDGDLIVLKDARGRVVDGIAYGAWETGFYQRADGPKRGEAIMRVELQREWAVTTTPTPGQPNVLTNGKQKTESATTAVPASDEIRNPASSSSFRPEAEPERGDLSEPVRSDPSASLGMTKEGLGVTKEESGMTTEKLGMTSVKKPPEQKRPAVQKSRFKGRAYEAAVAVPPGVYGKTKMFVLIDGGIRELRLTKSAGRPFEHGERIRFIAQEKRDGEAAFLLANVNSLASLETVDEPEFEPADRWPERPGPYALQGTVTALDQRRLRLRLSGKEGEVLLPSGSAKPPFEAGDTVLVRGFVSATATPFAYLADADGLTLLKAFSRAEPPAEKPLRLGWPTAAGLTAAAGLAGVLAYLRHERLKRLALTERAPREEFVESE